MESLVPPGAKHRPLGSASKTPVRPAGGANIPGKTASKKDGQVGLAAVLVGGCLFDICVMNYLLSPPRQVKQQQTWLLRAISNVTHDTDRALAVSSASQDTDRALASGRCC